MATSLYIYYRTDSQHLPVRQLATALIADIVATTGIRGRLLQRRDDAQTWMEIYEPVHDTAAFGAAMQMALGAQPALAALARHEEWFVEADR